MLKRKTFIKKTRKGGVIKIVREHYLRDDIWCGSYRCSLCPQDTATLVLEDNPTIESDLCDFPHYIVPDTNVVLHQIDVLEDIIFNNIILLQTVLSEVKRRSTPVYKRLRDLISNADRHFYVFTNEHHCDTYIEREAGETSNDYNDRAIRKAVAWYNSHLKESKRDDGRVQVVLLTNDKDNRRKAKLDGLFAFTIHEYVKALLAKPELADKLALLDKEEDRKEEENGMTRDGRILFTEHLAMSQIQTGIKQGKYLQGSFKVSRDNYTEANILVHGEEDKAIFIKGLMNINRAVNDDIVAIEMLPESQWLSPSSMVVDDTTLREDDSLETLDDTKPKANYRSHTLPSGKVVGIIKRNWRPYCGILEPSIFKQSTRHLFTPAERRIPKIRIETRQAASLQGNRILVAIDSWPRTSRYPQGHYVRKIGEIGDKETENEVLLLEHDVPHQPFSQAVLNCLPKMPWCITEEDSGDRQDLRSLCIVSVDPPGCTDIDDALHCCPMDNGNFEVGVHIADVTHFIQPNTPLDREAADRGTTVYLVDKRIDMVPELLSSNLCSLRSNEDRLAFSCIWEVNKDAQILATRFTKSIICSRAAMTYEEAQLQIDDTGKSDEITLSLRNLNKLAKILKKGRIDKGALTLASAEVRFSMDSETHDPIDVETKQLRETNSMVEEFMLLANISVATKICEVFPQCALLRRHPSPPPANYDPLIKAGQSKGVKIETESSKALAMSLERAELPGKAYFNTLLRMLATRCMMQAVYFCSGMLPQEQYFHYGLATPIYTHFTSPIRRYSDIVVHRLLGVSIAARDSSADLLDKHRIQKLCNNLNHRHKMGQYAGRASVSLHTQLFFKNKTVEEEAFILYVKQNALQVLIPKFGLEGTLYLKPNKDTKNPFKFNEEESTLIADDTKLHVFDRIVVQISIDNSNIQHQKLCLKLVTPCVSGISVNSLENNTRERPIKKIKKS